MGYNGTSGLLSLVGGSNSFVWNGSALAINSGTFALDSTGKVTATNGSFSGPVNASNGSFTGTVFASGGNIGGWNINSTQITIPNSITLDSSTKDILNSIGESIEFGESLLLE